MCQCKQPCIPQEHRQHLCASWPWTSKGDKSSKCSHPHHKPQWAYGDSANELAYPKQLRRKQIPRDTLGCISRHQGGKSLYISKIIKTVSCSSASYHPTCVMSCALPSVGIVACNGCGKCAKQSMKDSSPRNGSGIEGMQSIVLVRHSRTYILPR